MDDEQGASAPSSPYPLDALWALRSDYEDVPVPEMGGKTFRVYALTGTARARLLPDMAELAATPDGSDKDPGVVRAVFAFQTRVVAASLGYAEPLWDRVGDVMGSGAIERLYSVAARLSALDKGAKGRAEARLKVMPKVASGAG